jgi:hypothetical protein
MSVDFPCFILVTENQDFCSRNLSNSNSPGLVTRNDPAYVNIPTDSRQPPAPIDPSSEYMFLSFVLHSIIFLSHSLKVVLHLIRPGLEGQK